MSDLDLSAAQQAGFLDVEDLLIEFRDARLSILGYANGVVVNEKDGSPSPIVRMRTRHATDLAITTAAPLIEAAVRAQVAAEIVNIELDAVEHGYKTYAKAMHRAARIARGESA